MEDKVQGEIDVVEVYRRIGRVIHYLGSRWKIITLIVVLSALIGLGYSWNNKTNYIAEMSFVTDTESKGAMNAYAGLAAQFGIDLGGSSSSLFEGDNLMELLKSKNLVVQTLLTPSGFSDNRLMIEYYVELKELDKKESIRNLQFSDYGKVPHRLRDSLIHRIADDIRKKQIIINKRDKKLSIIDLRVTSEGELFSKRFVEILASNAIRFYTDYKVRKSLQNVKVLERQTDSVRAMLYGSLSDAAVINDLNINPLRQAGKIGSQRKQIEMQVNSALYTELVKNLELSRLSLRREAPLIQIIDVPVLPLEKKGKGRLKAAMIFGFAGGFVTVIVLLFTRAYRRLNRKTLRDETY